MHAGIPFVRLTPLGTPIEILRPSFISGLGRRRRSEERASPGRRAESLDPHARFRVSG